MSAGGDRVFRWGHLLSGGGNEMSADVHDVPSEGNSLPGGADKVSTAVHAVSAAPDKMSACADCLLGLVA